jgi:hypothetical protein
MNRGRVGEERRGKETDGCPLTLTGNKPNLINLHEFGTKVWVHDTSGSKLNGRSCIGCWVGFNEVSNGHRIYWPDKMIVSIERNIKFDDDRVMVFQTITLEGELVGKPEGSAVLKTKTPYETACTNFIRCRT